MERVIKYFDRIKADEEMKAKTMSYIRDSIASENGKQVSDSYLEKARRYTLKRLSLAVLPVTACALLIGGCAFYNTPVNYISLDINPSVELGLNYFNRVVEVEGINRDGEILLKENGIKNISAEDAIKQLTLEAKEKGYIQGDGSTVIAVTALSEQVEEAVQLRNQMGETLRTMIQQGDLNAVVYTDSDNLNLREEARDLKLSPGKYKLILLLQSLSSDIELEQYRGARITDILVTANELLLKNEVTESGQYEWNYEMIKEAAGQVRETIGNVIKEQNAEQERNGTLSPSAVVQEQAQNQSRKEKLVQDNNSIINQIDSEQEQTPPESSSSAIEQEQVVNQDQSQENQTNETQGQSTNSPDSGQEQPQGSNQPSGGQGGSNDSSKNPE